MSANFCITLTSIPRRINDIYKTLESIEKQTLKPSKIFLNIPNEYYRFPNIKISNKDLEKIKSELVEITRCNDYGPGTKILGSLEKVKNYDCVIIIDDDHIYNSEMCEIFMNEYEKENNNYSYYVQKVFDLNMAQCADGFLINTKHLEGIKIFYNKFVKKNKNLFLDDDLWLSIFLQKIKKKKIINLIEKFRIKTGKLLVYDIHTNIDALKENVYKHNRFMNRRKIAKIEYIKIRLKLLLNNLIN